MFCIICACSYPTWTKTATVLLLFDVRFKAHQNSCKLYQAKASDVNKATTPKAKATQLKAKNTTTFPQHLYRTINVLRSLQS